MGRFLVSLLVFLIVWNLGMAFSLTIEDVKYKLTTFGAIMYLWGSIFEPILFGLPGER